MQATRVSNLPIYRESYYVRRAIDKRDMFKFVSTDRHITQNELQLYLYIYIGTSYHVLRLSNLLHLLKSNTARQH